MYQTNKVIDLSSQHRRATSFFHYINTILPYILAEEDTIKLSTAKKILNSTSFIHKKLTKFFSESDAARMVQLTMNLAVVSYQWVFATTSTWFSYYLTSPSGLKKMYQCVFTNPIYGLLFYSTFYLKILGGTSDETKFNRVASVIGFPTHVDMGGNKVLSKIVNNVPEIITGQTVYGYKIITKDILKAIASSVLTFGAVTTVDKILVRSLKQTNPEISSLKSSAVYIADRDRFDFDDNDIQDQLNFIKKEYTNIKKYAKKYINPKNKQLKKQKFMQIAQVKAPDGHVMCLNKCQHKIKTQMGCYCEGDCGTTTFLGGKKWCWVDPEKCKNGKYLSKHRGYAYDLCDTTNLSKTKKCFTGRRYTDCTTR
jgi:hypothetical protein